MMTEKEKNRIANDIGTQVLAVLIDELHSLEIEVSSPMYVGDVPEGLADILYTLACNLELRRKDLEEAARTA